MHILLSNIAQTVGLSLFVFAFLLVLIYALAPGNKTKFSRAANVPLEEKDPYKDE